MERGIMRADLCAGRRRGVWACGNEHTGVQTLRLVGNYVEKK